MGVSARRPFAILFSVGDFLFVSLDLGFQMFNNGLHKLTFVELLFGIANLIIFWEFTK